MDPQPPEIDLDDFFDPPPEDKPAKPEGHRRNQREYARPTGQGPFPLLPARQAHILIQANFRSPTELMITPDEELLLLPLMSYWSVKLIRKVYPFAGGPPPSLMVCPCCQGRGRVRRFPYTQQRKDQYPPYPPKGAKTRE